jgi:hypothetical protein
MVSQPTTWQHHVQMYLLPLSQGFCCYQPLNHTQRKVAANQT